MTKLSRPKAIALFCLAVLLVVVALILWRPFGSSSSLQSNQSLTEVALSPNSISPSETVETQSPLPERVIRFPEDRSIGVLYVRDWDSVGKASAKSLLGEAQGAVTVPLGKDLTLTFFGQSDQDLSPLGEIGENDLQSLTLIGGGTEFMLSAWDETERRAVSNLTITDGDLRFIQHLRSLRELVFMGAQISDVGLAHLSGLTSVEVLQLSNTNVGDAGLAELKRLPLLRRLILWTNPQISDAGLIHLQSLPRLEEILLFGMSITDRGLAHLQSIKSLRSVRLIGTQVSPDGVAALKWALPDCSVSIQSLTVTPIPTPTPSPQVPVS